MKENSIIRRADKVLISKVDNEAIILGIESGMYIGLNEIGTIIWEQLEHPTLCVDLIATLMDIFEAPKEEIHKDVLEFLAKLEEKTLIIVEDAAK